MKLWVAILGACLGAAAPAFAAATPQPLSIRVQGDGAQATRLSEYDPSVPIAVTVTSGGATRLEALTVTALGPQGESIRAPLTRAADGTFTGSLELVDQGSWSLRLTSRAGSLKVSTLPVTLTVQAPPPSNAATVGLAVGAGIFITIGGSGFLILRRTISAPADGELEGAA